MFLNGTATTTARSPLTSSEAWVSSFETDQRIEMRVSAEVDQGNVMILLVSDMNHRLLQDGHEFDSIEDIGRVISQGSQSVAEIQFTARKGTHHLYLESALCRRPL